MSPRCGHFCNSLARTRRSVPRSRSAERALCPVLLMLWFRTFHRTISVLIWTYCFKYRLWPTLRQKFTNFWSVLTRPGHKHDDEKKKKIPASACRKKKIACSTNVIESLWEKKGKNILPTRLLGKKFLMIRNHPPLPSRVKWSPPYFPRICLSILHK